MKQPWFVVVVGALMLSACGQKPEVAPASTTPPPSTAQPAAPAAEAAPPAGEAMTPASAVTAGAAMEKVATAAEKMEKAVESTKGAVLGQSDALALAEKSGCLACHKVDTKAVGPSWRDVAKRYHGKADAKATLIASVKMGSKGKWADVTGGIPMPPNSPRVSDENIEKLVTFILSL